MTTNLGQGTLTLAGPEGDVTLIWDGKGKGKGKALRRGLPAGAYRVRTTRVSRKVKRQTWFVSSSGPAGEPVVLELGKTRAFDFDARVRFTPRARRRGAQLKLGMQIRDAEGRGLSVYRAGKRVRVTYAVLDAEGEELKRGVMNYG